MKEISLYIILTYREPDTPTIKEGEQKLSLFFYIWNIENPGFINVLHGDVDMKQV